MNSMITGKACTLAVLALLAAGNANADTAAAPPPVPLEVYGGLPSREDVCVSPDGTRIPYITTSGDQREVMAESLADGKILGGLKAGGTKVRRIEWADNDHLLVWISEATVPWGVIGSLQEWSQLRVYDVQRHRTTVVPDGQRLRNTHFMNVTWGHVMARSIGGHTVLFVPGIYLADVTLPGLIRIDLESGLQQVFAQGTADTRGWLVDEHGEIAAEEDYNDASGDWSIRTRRAGAFPIAISGRAPLDHPHVLGFGPTEDTLLIAALDDGVPAWQLLSIKDGTLGPPLTEHRELEAPIEDPRTHRMMGGATTGDDLRYVFFDPAMQRHWDSIVRAFTGARVHFVSASSDFQKIVVLVEGIKYGYLYALVDITTLKASGLGDVYDGVTAPLEVRSIRYSAGDGLAIPAYLTLPRGRNASALPLVVLPHGGPQQRDNGRFRRAWRSRATPYCGPTSVVRRWTRSSWRAATDSGGARCRPTCPMGCATSSRKAWSIRRACASSAPATAATPRWPAQRWIPASTAARSRLPDSPT